MIGDAVGAAFLLFALCLIIRAYRLGRRSRQRCDVAGMESVCELGKGHAGAHRSAHIAGVVLIVTLALFGCAEKFPPSEIRQVTPPDCTPGELVMSGVVVSPMGRTVVYTTCPYPPTVTP